MNTQTLRGVLGPIGRGAGFLLSAVLLSLCWFAVGPAAAQTPTVQQSVVQLQLPTVDKLPPANATDVHCHVLPARIPGQSGYGTAAYPDCDARSGMNVAPAPVVTGCNNGCAPLNDNGGPVVTAAQSTLIYLNCTASCWGNPFQFLSDFYASSFAHVFDQYMKPNVLRTSGRYTVNPSAIQITQSEPHTLFDSQLQTIILNTVKQQFPSGGGGGYNRLYAILLPQGQDLCFDNGGRGNCYCPDSDSTCDGGQWNNGGGGFCAYHSSFDSTDAVGNQIHIVYQALPYDNVSTQFGGCAYSDGPNGPTADSENNNLSHELSETITDPDGNAWWRNSDGQEIGDICGYISVMNPIYLMTRAYEFQMEYSNAAQDCVGPLPLIADSHAFAGIATIGGNDFGGTNYSVKLSSDILWHDSSGDLAIWLMNGGAVLKAAGVATVSTVWSIVGQRDFDGDGNADILWRDTSGDVAIWFMNGTSVASVASFGTIGGWTAAGTGDFNGDGMGDILWYSGGNVALWLMNGAAVSSVAVLGNVGTSWSVVGTGDFDGDGKTDILWRDTSGNLAIWFMNGTSVASVTSLGNVPTAWSVAGTGDFDGNGKSDILWRDNSGNVALWLMNGGAVSSNISLGTVAGWSVAQTGDYNGDGMSDILWRDAAGDLAMWLMSGAAVSSAAVIATVPTAWTVQGANAD